MTLRQIYLNKPFWKRTLKLAVPIALQNLLAASFAMVDTFMVAGLGGTVLSAVGMATQLSWLMNGIMFGIVSGTSIFVSQYWGAGDRKAIHRTEGIALVFAAVFSALFCLFGYIFAEGIVGIYTDTPAVIAYGADYIRFACWSYIPNSLTFVLCAVLRSTESVKLPVIISGCNSILNVFLNYCLIGGHCGFPKMGARGAALATVIASVVNAAVIVLIAKVKKYPYLFRFARHPRLHSVWMREYLRKCFPIICNELLVGIGFTVNNIVLGRQSEQAIAALAVFRTMEGFVIAFFSGFSNAGSVLVGKSVGAGELRIAYERAKRLVFLCGGCIAVVCALLFSVHSPLLHAMSLSGESFRICTGFVGIYCIAAVIRMCNWAQNDIYRSAGDAAYGTVLEIVFMYLMVIPCVCLSGLVFRLPVFLVFACCYIDEPFRFVLMQIHMYSAKWIRPVTEQGRRALPAFLKTLKKQDCSTEKTVL